MTTSLVAPPLQPTIWQDATPAAEVKDIIRKPFCPIARVVGKEVLKDGRTCLIVDFPNCDCPAEVWTLPATEVITPVPAITCTPARPAAASHTATAPAIIPAPPVVEENAELPNRGDNGHSRVLPIAKTDNKLAAIFTNRPKQYQQFLIIREELAAIGVKVGTLINSREDIKGWRLDWHGDKAGLYWTVGNGWEVSSLKVKTELTGNWKDFDLIEQLACNGIDLDTDAIEVVKPDNVTPHRLNKNLQSDPQHQRNNEPTI
jgi:hypothetical protein